MNTSAGSLERYGRTTRIFEGATAFDNETDGTWLLANFDGGDKPDLVYIKTKNTPNGQVEVHVASGESNYKKRIFEAPTTFANESDGTWSMANFGGGAKPDLVYIKTSNTANGQVEVHVANLVNRELLCHPHWMTDLGEKIERKKLRDLVLPASHDSGTYGITPSTR